MIRTKSFLSIRWLPACLCLALVATGPVRSEAPADAAIEVRLNHISIVETGAGSPVVLIPGLSTPREVWDQVAADLADSHRLVLVQVNGFGGDDPGANLEPGILDGIVDDLARHLEDANHERVAVVGHSMGGLAGLLFATRYPARVDRLLVVDALPFFAVQLVPPGSDISVAQAEPTARAMRDATASTHGSARDPTTTQAQVSAMSLNPENHAQMATWAMRSDARVVAQSMYENLTTDLRPELGSIEAPITVVYAWNAQGPGKDRIEAYFRRQYTNAAKLRMVGVADSGHFVMLDQPAVFGDALDAFLVEFR